MLIYSIYSLKYNVYRFASKKELQCHTSQKHVGFYGHRPVFSGKSIPLRLTTGQAATSGQSTKSYCYNSAKHQLTRGFSKSNEIEVRMD